MEKEGWIAVQHFSKTCFFRVGLLDHRTVLGSVSWELDAVSGSRHLCVRYLALRLVSADNTLLGRVFLLVGKLGGACVEGVPFLRFDLHNAAVEHACLPRGALFL